MSATDSQNLGTTLPQIRDAIEQVAQVFENLTTRAKTENAQEVESNSERMTGLLKNMGGQPTGGNPGEEGGHTESISSKANALALQLQGAISRFAEELGGNHETTSALIRGFDEQLRKINASLERNKDRIETVASHVRNNRY